MSEKCLLYDVRRCTLKQFFKYTLESVNILIRDCVPFLMELCYHYGNFVKIRGTGIKESGDLFFRNRSPDSLFSFMQFCFIRKILPAIQQVLVRRCIQICKEFINRRSVDGIIHFLCRRGRILRLETMVNRNAKPRNQCNCHY